MLCLATVVGRRARLRLVVVVVVPAFFFALLRTTTTAAAVFSPLFATTAALVRSEGGALFSLPTVALAFVWLVRPRERRPRRRSSPYSRCN